MLHKNFAVALIVFMSSHACLAENFDVEIPLRQANTGSVYVKGYFGAGVEAEFLVDTGSGLLTINEALFAKISRTQQLKLVGERYAKLANGRGQRVKLYRVDNFRLGNGCSIGEVEVAVLSKKGRNLLGLNVLSKVAPFSMSLSPPTLAVSDCDVESLLVAAR